MSHHIFIVAVKQHVLDCSHSAVFFHPVLLPQRVECGEASGSSPEGAHSSILCILCSVPPRGTEPGGDGRLRLSGAGVEAWCWWCEWPTAAGLRGSQQLCQHSLFWLWRYDVHSLLPCTASDRPPLIWNHVQDQHKGSLTKLWLLCNVTKTWWLFKKNDLQ